MMSTKKKLSYDEYSAKSSVRNKEQELKKINAGLPKVLNFFDAELTDQEIRELKDYNSIVDKFRSQFPHPNAKDELNFELIGKDTSGLKDASLILKLINDDYIIKSGKVEICPTWYDRNIENFTKYTTSEAENQAFEYATQLAKLMQKGFEAGYYQKYDMAGLNKAMQLFRLNENGGYDIQGGRLSQASQRAEAIKQKANQLKETA